MMTPEEHRAELVGRLGDARFALSAVLRNVNKVAGLEDIQDETTMALGHINTALRYVEALR